MLTGALVVLIIVVGLLAIPLTLTFRVAWREAFDNDFLVKWAFGLIQTRIPIEGTSSSAKPPQTDDRKPRIGDRSSGKSWNILAAVRHRGFRQRVFRFMKALWRAVRKRDVRLRVRLGLGDPADTGRLWAALGPISGLLANVPDASIRIEPEFQDATIELESSGSIRIIPLQLIYLTAALLLSPLVWQGLRQARGR